MRKSHKALFVAAATAATLVSSPTAHAHAQKQHASIAHKKNKQVILTEKEKEKEKEEKLTNEAKAFFERVKNHPTLLKDMEIAAPHTGMPVDKQLTLIKWEYEGAPLNTPKASVKNSASSATGVMQILDNTFIEMVAKYGQRYRGIIAEHYQQTGRDLDAVLPFVAMKGGAVVLNHQAYNAQAAKGLKGALLYAQKHGQDLKKAKHAFLAQHGSLERSILRLRSTPLVSLLLGQTALKEAMASRGATQAKTSSIGDIYAAHQFGPTRSQKMVKHPHTPMKCLVPLPTLKNNNISANKTPAQLKLEHEKEAKVLGMCFREDLAKLKNQKKPVQAVARTKQSQGFLARWMSPS